MKKEINVLGTKYKVIELIEKDGYMQGSGSVGYTDLETKEIYYIKGVEEKETVIHEVLHAMFYEAGVPIGMGIHTEGNICFLEKKIGKIVDYFTTD